MPKTILITGSTDGIGLEAAKALVKKGHRVILHGRNSEKLNDAKRALSDLADAGVISAYLADLSSMSEVSLLADQILAEHTQLDVLINNAGIFKTPTTITSDGLDIRFAVNTLAPYLLTQKLMPVLAEDARVINLSSAAQAPVDLEALAGKTELKDDMAAYAQSKLAITLWTQQMALKHQEGPIFVAVNPGSLLATKMVKEAFGRPGNDINIGSDILVRAALSDEFASASGQYFDNDARQFGPAHPDTNNAQIAEQVTSMVKTLITQLTH